MVFSSLRRSKNTSGFASGLLASEYRTPSCSPTNRRSEPGQRAISSGWLNFAFGNTRTALYAGGGSGEPVTLEVVHGLRGAAFGSWAKVTARNAANPAAARMRPRD